MKAIFDFNQKTYVADLTNPVDISIPLREGPDTVNCFYAPLMEISPVIAGDFIGDTRRGGPVNFVNIKINPHGNGTHTECVGHISEERITINEQLKKFLYLAKVISIFPEKTAEGDKVIFKKHLADCFSTGEAEALIIRTLPNDVSKATRHYSGTNPPYFHPDAIRYLVDCGVRHLLTDLPSVDREEDEGALSSHRAFWHYPESPRSGCTITELIFVPDEIQDELFLLNIQIASFESDASPSKPVLYKLE